MEHLDEACRIGNGNAGHVNVAQRNGSDRALPGTRQRLRRGAELLGGDWDKCDFLINFFSNCIIFMCSLITPSIIKILYNIMNIIAIISHVCVIVRFVVDVFDILNKRK